MNISEIEKGETNLNENEIDDYNMQPSFNINVESGIIDMKQLETKPDPKQRITSASVRNSNRILSNTTGNMSGMIAKKNRNS